MIQIDHLSKSFELSRAQRKEMGPEFKGSTVYAVKDLSLEAKPGRILVCWAQTEQARPLPLGL